MSFYSTAVQILWEEKFAWLGILVICDNQNSGAVLSCTCLAAFVGIFGSLAHLSFEMKWKISSTQSGFGFHHITFKLP